MTASSIARDDAFAARAVSRMLWVNGHRVDPAAPHISALDRGFTLADGLFETMRAYDGVIFRLDRHLARLAAGADVLGIALPDHLDAFVADALSTACAAGVRDARIRLTVSRGIGESGLAPSASTAVEPTVVLAIEPMRSGPPAIYAEGLSARIARGRRNERSATCGIKALAYTDAIIAMAEAHAAGADDAILLDVEGHVSEAAASNVFLCVHDTLITPPRSCGVLPGITREAVIEIAPSLGLAVIERVVSTHDLASAAEAFLTSTIREIAPLVRVDDHQIGSGSPGIITRRIMEAYRDLVRRVCTP